MMAESTPMLPHVVLPDPEMRWFAPGGCVTEQDGEVQVTVGGILVGRFQREDIGTRNAVLVGLATDDTIHLGHLAAAFDLSEEMVRRIRRRYERGGLEAILPRTTAKVDDAVRASLEEMFTGGATITEAHRRIRRRCKISRATVGVVHKAWAARRAESPAEPPPEASESAPVDEVRERPLEAPEEAKEPSFGSASVDSSADRAERSCSRDAAVVTASAPFVQHVGTWLLLGAVEKYGLFDAATNVCRDHRLPQSTMRIALDAFITALALGEPCVEGVRRIATPTAPLLLRADHAPSADWVRTTFARLADEGATEFHLGMAVRYLEEARRMRQKEAVFYVDNHLRPYTGKHTLRRGWRMQDKRVLPGASD